MSYLGQETSREAGLPVELYKIEIGTEIFYLTSADYTVTALGEDWTPSAIKRSAVTISPEERNEVIEVTLPSTHAFPRKYISIVPGARGWLTIFRFHKTDGATPETSTLFKGVVRSVAFDQNGYEAKLAVLPMSSLLARNIPRHTFQGQCNNVLYDGMCQVISNSFRHNADLISIDSTRLILTVQNLNTKGDGWATGGYITFNAQDFRLVMAHTGSNVTLLIPFPTELNMLNQPVDVFAGCDHRISTCKTKFNNVINYGGAAFVPLKNPFATGIK